MSTGPKFNDMLIIGLDAASLWNNFGFAIGRTLGGRVNIEQVGRGLKLRDLGCGCDADTAGYRLSQRNGFH